MMIVHMKCTSDKSTEIIKAVGTNNSVIKAHNIGQSEDMIPDASTLEPGWRLETVLWLLQTCWLAAVHDKPFQKGVRFFIMRT